MVLNDLPHAEHQTPGRETTEGEGVHDARQVDILEKENKKQFDFYLVVTLIVGAVLAVVTVCVTKFNRIDVKPLMSAEVPVMVEKTMVVMIAVTSFFLLANMAAFYLRVVISLVKDSDKGRAMSCGLGVLAIVIPYAAFEVERLWVGILGILAFLM